MRGRQHARSLRTALATIAGVALVLVGPGAAWATNGYFTHGYGTGAKGLAGAGVAFPQDSLAAATNPAGMAFLGKRYDVGMALFNPNREYKVTGGPSQFPGTFGLLPGSFDSDSTLFQVPYFGANWEIGARSTFGVSVYGHGGMNTDWPTNTFFAATPTGVDLSQLFIVPTYAVRFGAGERHAVGLSPTFVFQRFEIQGVQSFAQFSSNPAALSNNGHNDSLGYGLKLGYLGRWTKSFSVGVAYQSEMSMEEFDDYAGLFAEQGGFDVPSSVWVGFAFDVNDKLTFVADLQEIYYTDIRSVSNPFLPNLVQAPLGADGGAGFGWEDMTVIKVGALWDSGKRWVWRVGVSSGDQPIPPTEVLFNILAPGVMEDHFTVGFTRRLKGGKRAFHFALMRAFSHRVVGNNPLEIPGLQQIELKMDQWDLEFGYSWGL